MRDKSISIYKVMNGWKVTHDWTEKDAKGDDDYKNEEFVFLTMEEVLAKVNELVTLMN